MEKRLVFLILIILINLISLTSAQQQVSKKILCESSDGQWINEECICPSNSVGFKEGFGCDYKSSYTNSNQSSKNIQTIFIVSLISGIILLILLIILIKFLKKKK